ncbi:hypothetical protein NX059_010656 [Plenodomus lindquistii]|nr:hypothetical protein NX059_010656 [Plenodomus lindquistii]
MNRDISPPPAKRRQTENTNAAAASSSIAVPTAPKVLPPLEEGAMRIFSWNINGIEPFLQNSITSYFQARRRKASATPKPEYFVHPPSLRGFLQRHKWPSILLLQEVKISVKDTRTQGAVRTAINSKLASEIDVESTGPRYEADFVLPVDRFNAGGPGGKGKVYGVCSILRKDLYSKYDVTIRVVSWDLEGRICVVQLISPTVRLGIYNIYAVNGTNNDWRDSETGALKGNRHIKKRMLHHNLAIECRELVEDGWHILLAGDMNVAPTALDGYPKLRTHPAEHVKNRQNFHQWLIEGQGDKVPGFQGVDIWREMHAEERRYTYFPPEKIWGSSCDRIDYFVAAREMWEKGWVRACGILDSVEERGTSDHVPIWADILVNGNEKRSVDEWNEPIPVTKEKRKVEHGTEE